MNTTIFDKQQIPRVDERGGLRIPITQYGVTNLLYGRDEDDLNEFDYSTIQIGNKNFITGDGTASLGEGSVTVGANALAAKPYAVSLGWQSLAINQESTALGANAVVGHDRSISLGSNSQS